MSLADRLASLPKKGQGGTCSIKLLFAALSDEDAAALQAALGDREIRGSTISKAIRDEFSTFISSTTLNRHRRGDCKCSVG